MGGVCHTPLVSDGELLANGSLKNDGFPRVRAWQLGGQTSLCAVEQVAVLLPLADEAGLIAADEEFGWPQTAVIV